MKILGFHRIENISSKIVLISFLVFLILTDRDVQAQNKKFSLFGQNRQTTAKTSRQPSKNIDDLSKASNSRENAAEAIRKIPWNAIEPGGRAQLESLIKNHTIYRRLPMSGGYCNPEMFDFLLCHPDVVVALWESLGYAQVSLKEVSPSLYNIKETTGTVGSAQILYHDNELLVAYCKGTYQGPLIPRPLEGDLAIVLQVRYTEDQKGLPIVICRLDSFIRVKNIGVELMGRVFQPLIGKVADTNFVQTIDFVNGISKSAEENPDSLQNLIEKSRAISAETKRSFLETADRVCEQYYMRERGEFVSYQMQSKRNQPLGGSARVLARNGVQATQESTTNRQSNDSTTPTGQAVAQSRGTSPDVRNLNSSAENSSEYIPGDQYQQRFATSGTSRPPLDASNLKSTNQNESLLKGLDFSLADDNSDRKIRSSSPTFSKDQRNVAARTKISEIPSLSVESKIQSESETLENLSLNLGLGETQENELAPSDLPKFQTSRPAPRISVDRNRLNNDENLLRPIPLANSANAAESSSDDGDDEFNSTFSVDRSEKPTILLHQFNGTPETSDDAFSEKVAIPQLNPLPTAKRSLNASNVSSSAKSSLLEENGATENASSMLALPSLDDVYGENAQFSATTKTSDEFSARLTKSVPAPIVQETKTPRNQRTTIQENSNVASIKADSEEQENASADSWQSVRPEKKDSAARSSSSSEASRTVALQPSRNDAVQAASSGQGKTTSNSPIFRKPALR